MIGRIRGKLIEKNPPQILVDAGGVGYEIDVPMSTFYNLPEIGADVTLLTHFVVREDAQLLYGFLTALSILSGMTVQMLAQAIAAQDSAMLTRIPGIGKKTAERLVLELKGKLGADLEGVSLAGAQSETKSDIVSALIALGYSERDSIAAAKRLPEDISVSEGIRQALKSLSH